MLSPADISLMTDKTINILDSIDDWSETPTRVDIEMMPTPPAAVVNLAPPVWSDDEVTLVDVKRPKRFWWL